MKKLFFTFALAISLNMSAQSYQVVGNEYIQTVQTDKKTGLVWVDAKGVKHDIYISKRGAVYYIATSKKTGKQYKRYLPKEVAEDIKTKAK